MSAEPLREIIARLQVSAGVLAALGAWLEERVSGRPLDAGIKGHVDEIAKAAGATTALASEDPAEVNAMLGQIRTFALQNVALLFPAGLRPARVHQALRPQGWLILALHKQREDLLANAVTRLRVALFGGCLLSSQQIETMLASAGFAAVRALPSSDTSLVVMIAAQRIRT